MMGYIECRSARQRNRRGVIVMLLLVISQIAFATTWAPAYPYTQRTEGGEITCRSVPYGVRDGPFGLGETFVYRKGQLLYSVEKYFSKPFLTHGHGRYLISIDFHAFHPDHDIRILGGDDDGIRGEDNRSDTKVIHIYDQGVLLSTVAFGDLRVDSSKIRVNMHGGWFAWCYSAPEQGSSALQESMAKHPAFIEADRLCLITADGQLIEIDVPSGEVVGRSIAVETLKKRSDWSPSNFKRRYERVKYPDKFHLPSLKDGRSLEMAVADLLGMSVPREHGQAEVDIYVHTLLINREGRCEQAYVTVTSKKGGAEATQALEERVLAWVKEQKFDIRSIPRGFDKFKYSGFLLLVGKSG